MTSCNCNGRHIIIGEPELHLAIGALTVAQARTQGMTKFCSVDQLAIEIETDSKKKMRACRGLKQLVKTSNRNFELKYKTTLGNLGISEMALLYSGSDSNLGTTQPALANVDGTVFNFDTGASGVAYTPGKWMQLLDAAGNPVHDLEAVLVSGGNTVYGVGQDSATLVEGVDFEVDLKLGKIAFRAAIDDDVITPKLTAAAITSTSPAGFLKGFKPAVRFTHRGIGSLFVFDDDEDDNLAIKHVEFEFDLIATSGPTLGDDDFGNVEVELSIINPGTANLYARPDVDLWGDVIS